MISADSNIAGSGADSKKSSTNMIQVYGPDGKSHLPPLDGKNSLNDNGNLKKRFI